MKPIVLTDAVAVGEFPSTEELAILAKAGFKSIINNQPDGEVARFPPAVSIAVEAEKLGLAHVYVPIETRTPEPEAIAAFAKAARTLPEPIYAFCYSGARSAAACAFLLAEQKEVGEIVSDLDQGGFDVRALAPWLEEARAAHKGKATAAAGEPKSAAPVHQQAANGANGKGNGANGQNAATVQAPTPPAIALPPTPARPEAAAPPPAVIYPRAAGFGGFAM